MGTSTAAKYRPIRSMTRASAVNSPRNAYHAPVAATQKEPVIKDARYICGNRTQSTGLNRIAAQSLGTNVPFCTTWPSGTCIQLLLAMIQKAESVVPSATIAVDNK